MKKNDGFLFGFAALVAAMCVLLSACQNPSLGGSGLTPVLETETEPGSSGSGGGGGSGKSGSGSGTRSTVTGRISVKLAFEGILSASGVQRSVQPAARTVYPASIGITKYVLTFTPTSGGAAHAPLEVTGNTGLIVTAEVELVEGTYTITVTAYKGDTAIAEGSMTATVSGGQTTTVSITVGPKAGAGNGTLTYDITLPPGIDNSMLSITTLSGGTVSGGTIPLTAGQGNTGSLTLASGFYQARLTLTLGGRVAGFSGEVIYIYSGLESPLVRVYTLADFVEVRPVDDFNLTGLFSAPVTGAMAETVFEGTQYTGVIQWKAGAAGHSGLFGAATAYTAVITLTAKTPYTFDGVWTNRFTHGSIRGNNAPNSGVVTMVFPATAVTGGLDIAIGFIGGAIDISGSNGENRIERFNRPNTLTLRVEGFENISWYVDGAVTGLAVNPLTLRGIDYSLGGHRVTFTGYKDGAAVSQEVPFTVTHTLPFTSVEAARLYLSTVSGGVDNPVFLPMGIDLSASGDGWYEVLPAIAEAGDYVDLDLSRCSMNGTEFDPDWTVDTGKDRIVGLTLPDEAERIKGGSETASAFWRFTSLKNVSGNNIKVIGEGAFANGQYDPSSLSTANFPAATDIGWSAFYGCAALTTVNLPTAASIGSQAFAYCSALTTVNLPAVASIGSQAFLSCAALTVVNLPTVTDIGWSAFYDCAALIMADFPAVTSIGDASFGYCSSLTTVNLPAAASIGFEAFFVCAALTTVNLPKAISIGSNAFSQCYSLTTVNLPAVTSIGGQAFHNCYALTTVNLPAAASIGNAAFHTCTALATVNLPVVSSIGDFVFFNTGTNALAIIFPGAAPSISKADFYSDPYAKTVTIKRSSDSTDYDKDADTSWEEAFKTQFGSQAALDLRFEDL